MIVGANECVHLTVEQVREIHTAAIARFGGLAGVREPNLLESAVAAPQATFDDRSVNADIIDVAGAYLFYICRNHPFFDGNKCAALGACLVFLRLNGMDTPPDGPDWERLMLDVASGSLDRDASTARLRRILEG